MQPLWKTIWNFLKKLKIKLLYDLAIPLLGMYPKKTKSLAQRDTCTPMFIGALFTVTETWKQPECPLTVEWIKRHCVYITEFYSAIEKLPFVTT